MTYELAPSILSADLGRLADEVAAVEPYSGRIHVDVMDGHFVPNLTMGPVVVKGLSSKTELPLEVHLMIEDPRSYIEPFAEVGASTLIFHVEVVRSEEVAEVCRRIHDAGLKAGIALNPETAWEERFLVDGLDLVCVMCVNPGFGGQSFMAEMLPKVTLIRKAVTAGGSSADIEVDGGIDPETASRARAAGANVFVAGNAVFGADDPGRAAKEMKMVVMGEAQ